MKTALVRSFVTSVGVLAAFALGTADGQAQQGVDLSAFVDFYYQYNFNKVDPSLRSFDVQHNAFSLSLAEVALEKAPTERSRIGGRIDLDFGRTADLVAAFEPESDGTEVYKHIQQAYISVLAGENLTIDFGKFVTPIGAEVIESQDNWNYTRSILFGYAIPFYHSGVRATIAASDQLSVSGFVLNGWNNDAETNWDKTFAGSIALTPNDQVSWVGNIMVGKEFNADADPGDDVLKLFDTTISFAATEMLSLMGNFDYGKVADTEWWGLAAYARFQPQDDWAIAGRYEYIDDSEGGFMTIGETAQSFTVTSDHLVYEDLIARLEFRVDNVSQGDNAFDYFTKHNGEDAGSQPSLTLGLVYTLN